MSLYADIIIPTWNNPEYLNPCVASILQTGVLDWMGRVIIVNNGEQDCANEFARFKNILVVEAPKNDMGEKMNLGWEGGLKLGLQYSDSPYVVFQNDDTFIPRANGLFYQRLLSQFRDPAVAAVGPSTTVAMGLQSIFNPGMPVLPSEVNMLIFFCVMIRRSHLEEVGGIDTSLPGGDDLDLSARFRQAGKKIIFDPRAFLIHHGFKTGERVEGKPNQKDGWNSIEKMERTNFALITKHGLRGFLDLLTPASKPHMDLAEADSEGDLCREALKGEKILEMGCGSQKTVPQATGIDRVPYGDLIPAMGGKCVAEVICDAEKRLPFDDYSQDTILARHILEHCIDPISAVRHWNRVLKMGGRLIVAVPDEDLVDGIPMNPEHKHAFTKDSLHTLLTTCGFAGIEVIDPQNLSSLVAVYQKVIHCPANFSDLVLA